MSTTASASEEPYLTIAHRCQPFLSQSWGMISTRNSPKCCNDPLSRQHLWATWVWGGEAVSSPCLWAQTGSC